MNLVKSIGDQRERSKGVTVVSLLLYTSQGLQAQGFFDTPRKIYTSYRALDLESDIAGGSHVKGFPIKAIPVLTKHDRGRSTVMAERNEEKKNAC